MIHDELALDGVPGLNLASFVHTWMPEEADKLMMENISKNLIDQDEYPLTRTYHSVIERRVHSSLILFSRRGYPHALHLNSC